MATQQTQVLGRALLTPAVALLFIWMIVPLAMTIYFSTLHYSLLDPGTESFVGLENYRYFLTDPAFFRDADCQRAGLEKPADASGLRTVRVGRDADRCDADRLVHRRASSRGDPDRRLAMAAVCDPHPAHRAAVPGRRAEGSGRDGRCERVFDVPLSHTAAPRATHYGRHPD